CSVAVKTSWPPIDTVAVDGITLTETGTAKLMALLVTPPTITTTLPVVAPAGTGATMLVALQLVAVAGVPLKVIVLVPCVVPRFVPVIVTNVPGVPDVGLRLTMFGTAGVVAVAMFE